MKYPLPLLIRYAETILAKDDPHYESTIQTRLNKQIKLTKQGEVKSVGNRNDAVYWYVEKHLENNPLEDSLLASLHDAASMDPTYYRKITASVGPLLDKINQTAAGDIFSWTDATNQPVITLETIIKKQQVVYVGLDVLSNCVMSEAIGQALIADLISLCGRLYKASPENSQPLCLYLDEFSDIVQDDCIRLLNKAGGAGVQVTAFSQTLQDIFAPFGSNLAKPQQLLGNFGTVIMLRIANYKTATHLTDCLAKLPVRHTKPETMAKESERFNQFTAHNSDTLCEESQSLITPDVLFALPKGHAFVLANGGALYKIRIPLLQRQPNTPKTFEALLTQINGIKNHD